jgi:hypothetical protein
MPNRWPIANGNWSDAAIWSGSIIPTASDAVFANNRSVYIDTNITVQSLSNASGTGITQGGIFYLNNGVNVNLTANPAMQHTGPVVYAATNTPLVIISGSNTASLTGSLGLTLFGPKIHLQDNSSLYLSGSVTSTNNTANIGIRHSSTGSLVIVGNVSGSSVGGSAHCIYVDGPGSLFISGSVIGAGSSYGIYNLSSGNIRIIGNVNGPNLANGATSVYNLANGSVIVTGSVYGGPDANYNGKWGIYNAGAGSVYISGSVFGGQGGQQANGVANASTGLVIINGNVTAAAAGSGPNASMYGVFNSGTGTLIIRGAISASTISPGVGATSTTSTNLFTGPFYNTGSYNAVYAYRMLVFDQPTRWTFNTETAGITKTLTTVESINGAPSASNVRNGVAYGVNGNLIGTLKMPDPTTVKTGVAVDNTTGSAILTAEDMFGVLTQNITTSGSIGTLLTGASTAQTVAATIASFKV